MGTGDKNGNKKFNVLCHGDLWMQNVVFSYGSCLESQSDVVDVRFDDLHHARYASCATDIHNLLYYTVDADIRRDHTVNLLAVYHDHFSKVSPFFYHSFLFSEHVNVLSSWLSNVSFA